MKQSRRMSLIEAIANVAIGYGLAVLTQMVVFPIFGLRASVGDNLALAAVFTAISLARSYVLRRVFEAVTSHGAGTMTARHEARRHRAF